MAEALPYMNSSGLVSKILDKIKSAQTPDRFSYDFMDTVLGYGSGSARPFISMAKRLSLLNSDGSPTELYRRFRGSDDESRAAMAQAIKTGYAPLYKRNEYVHKLEKKKLEGLIREVTGWEESNSALRATVGTFEALKKYADFDKAPNEDNDGREIGKGRGDVIEDYKVDEDREDALPLRFGYTININLPDSSDISVFNAIFKSMREHLL